MKNAFSAHCIAQHPRLPARVMQIQTPHGEATTPCFMPVATRAAVNCLTTPHLEATGSQIILGGNTYHMLVSPGMPVLQAIGGMHRFMHWQGPMLTDSGGYQVFSLSRNGKICKIDADGAHFKHPISGQVIHLTPESSIETQKIIGADIIMAFDECTPEQGGRDAALAAMERTHRWLAISKDTHEKQPDSIAGCRQAFFGIIQGGRFRDLREQSAEFICKLETDGIAIGGESIGYDMAITAEILDWVRPLLPAHKVRYTMGVGLNPQDLIDVVSKGVDIFDCVAPTRNARHGALYHGHTVLDGDWVKFESEEPRGRLLIKKSLYAHDERPILAGCDCPTCQHYSRAYLHFLFKNDLPLFEVLACQHNVRVMHRTCEMMRACVQSSAVV